MSIQINGEEYLTVGLNTIPILAEKTGVSYHTIYTWAKAKKISTIKIGGIMYSTIDAVWQHMSLIRSYRQDDSFVRYYSKFADIADERIYDYDDIREELNFLYLDSDKHSHKRRSCLEHVRKMEVI